MLSHPGSGVHSLVPANLEIVFVDWLDALRRGDAERIAARLATAIELIEVGDHVVLSVRATTVGVPVEPGRYEPRGRTTIVFTIRDGSIVHIRDYPGRAEALAAAAPGLPETWSGPHPG
jgi:hypothetical protein